MDRRIIESKIGAVFILIVGLFFTIIILKQVRLYNEFIAQEQIDPALEDLIYNKKEKMNKF